MIIEKTKGFFGEQKNPSWMISHEEVRKRRIEQEILEREDVVVNKISESHYYIVKNRYGTSGHIINVEDNEIVKVLRSLKYLKFHKIDSKLVFTFKGTKKEKIFLRYDILRDILLVNHQYIKDFLQSSDPAIKYFMFDIEIWREYICSKTTPMKS